ncbi:large-conductance mechanosensitive channel [Hyaloraphidium curvatum]|nr:large-conductance mechanosensitive channel [Hyaloraphidium curvatum]
MSSSESQPLLSQLVPDAIEKPVVDAARRAGAAISDAIPDEIEKGAADAVAAVGGFFSDFWTFLSRGNVMDLAVGIIIGAAFQDIIKSLVGDIFSPVIGLFTGSSLGNEFALLRPGRSGNTTYNTPVQAADDGAVPLKWGAFVQTLINFVIIGFVLFLIVRIAKAAQDSQAAAAAAAPAAASERECPACLEKVKKAAKACKFCTRDLPPA